MTYFPLMLDLRDRPVLFIAGGPETEVKLKALLEAHARITVLAEEDHWNLADLAKEGRIHWLPRGYREGDLEGFFLVVSHPRDKAIHPQVKAEAERRRVFLVAVDDPKNTTAILPAVVRRGDLVVALSTSGAAPALAVRLKERLLWLLGPEYGELVAYLRTLRPKIAALPDFGERRQLWYRIVDLALKELDLAPDPEKGLHKAKAKVEEALKEAWVWTR
ncbi:precorrin-2 dehydrogenase/sirohydrochlorin ferrochelatase family protein [Thermus caldifontis]|uniref:precorrin-2 dehydrogenase/sirohydrochlorin ferrochelatase family protein n=1 Tax=Thermus caldifontis TaxID=1930763 RepID=UPI000DF36082|nr:bifunctional precorrin-2 dehydrogenase/sirohydrochlorin ferrochelatase [Thermus caldifontis]